MKFNYKFSNLLGTVYRSGDTQFTNDGNTLICPVGNKLSMYDLANNRSTTMPIEVKFNFERLALSPDGNILLASQGAMLHMISLSFKRTIYQKKLYGKISKIMFSPDGKYFSVCKGRKVFVYTTPSLTRRFYDPFSLKRVYDYGYDEVGCVDWSHDSKFISFGALDMLAHVAAFARYENFRNTKITGHSSGVVGVFFLDKSYDLCTVSQNCVVNVWSCSGVESLIPETKTYKSKTEKVELDSEEEEASQNLKKQYEDELEKLGTKKHVISYSRKSRIFLTEHLKRQTATLTATCFKKENNLLVAAFADGDFLLLDISDGGSLIHSLNVAKEGITSASFNNSGDWIAIGVASTGKLLVWEWQSETHVLKQQGHFSSMNVVAYSPDCLYIATGGEDAKVKLWSTQSSFCFVTFTDHTSAVTGVAFTQSGKAILSSSLDGTVRAFDLVRYRNFKTLTSPKPTQFSCLAVDSSGELVVAGGQDNHDIFLWSLQTGKLLEVLGGHGGPVSSVQFSAQLGSTKLISTAWDRTVKVWDAIASTTSKETVSVRAEGMCVAFRPDGEQFAVATMNGHITFFNTSTCVQEASIEGRNDLKAGQRDADKISAKSNLKVKCFTCLSYSSDGKFILAGGQSKNVCIYSIEDELLVKKFEITQNRSLDGMDTTISRKKMAENGINLSLVEKRRGNGSLKVPGTVRGDMSVRSIRPEVRVTSLAFSKTGESWAACTTEGLLVYSLNDSWLFDPLHLEKNNTPEAVRKKLRNKCYSQALMMAARLNLSSLVQEVIESIPLKSISVVVDSLELMYVEGLIKVLPTLVETSRHLGFYCVWVTSILTKHGQRLKQRAPQLIADLSHLQKALSIHNDHLTKVCSHNEYTLEFLLCQASLKKKLILKNDVADEEVIEEENPLISEGSDSNSDSDSASSDANVDENHFK